MDFKKYPQQSNKNQTRLIKVHFYTLYSPNIFGIRRQPAPIWSLANIFDRIPTSNMIFNKQYIKSFIDYNLKMHFFVCEQTRIQNVLDESDEE